MQELPSETRAMFNDAERAEIAAHKPKLGDDQSDALGLAIAWERPSRRSISSALPWSDRSGCRVRIRCCRVVFASWW